MNEPLVSIVVAASGRVEYLGEAIRSALAQRYRRIEVLVTDDGRGRDVADLVRSLDDGRCAYRQNGERLGPAGNHAAGFRAARGKYVAILNHDDVWHPDFLLELVPPLEEDPSVVLSFNDHAVIDAGGKVLEEHTRETSRRFGREGLAGGLHQPFDNLLASQAIPMAMGAVFRRSALDVDRLPEAAGPAYDLWITYLLCATRGGAFYVPRRLSSWRVHGSSLTAAAGVEWTKGAAACWRAVVADERLASIRPRARQLLAEALLSAAAGSLVAGNAGEARGFAVASLRARPSPASLRMIALAALPRSLGRAAILRHRARRA